MVFVEVPLLLNIKMIGNAEVYDDSPIVSQSFLSIIVFSRFGGPNSDIKSVVNVFCSCIME